MWDLFHTFVTYVGTFSLAWLICYMHELVEMLSIFTTFVTYVTYLSHLFIGISISHICHICGKYLWHMWLIFFNLSHMWDLGIDNICHILWALVTSYLPHSVTFWCVQICDICVTCGKCGNLVLKRFHHSISHICHIFFNLWHLSICHIYLSHIIYNICHIFSICDIYIWGGGCDL